MKYSMVALDRDGDVWARPDHDTLWECLSNVDKSSCCSDALRNELAPISVFMVAKQSWKSVGE